GIGVGVSDLAAVSWSGEAAGRQQAWVGPMSVVVLVAACVAVSVTVPAAAQDVPVVPWSDALPPVVPDEPAPDHGDQCGEDGLACLAWVEEQLAGWEAHFGCDHRAVF
ncbi:hypothetical protein DF186_14520, partial [Enterococcus hirae]